MDLLATKGDLARERRRWGGERGRKKEFINFSNKFLQKSTPPTMGQETLIRGSSSRPDLHSDVDRGQAREHVINRWSKTPSNMQLVQMRVQLRRWHLYTYANELSQVSRVSKRWDHSSSQGRGLRSLSSSKDNLPGPLGPLCQPTRRPVKTPFNASGHAAHSSTVLAAGTPSRGTELLCLHKTKLLFRGVTSCLVLWCKSMRWLLMILHVYFSN